MSTTDGGSSDQARVSGGQASPFDGREEPEENPEPSMQSVPIGVPGSAEAFEELKRRARAADPPDKDKPPDDNRDKGRERCR